GLAAHYQRWLAERPFALNEPFARVPMKLAVSTALSRAELPAEVADQFAELAFELGPDGKRLPSPLDAAVEGWKQRSERAKSIDWGNLRRALTHCKSDGERLFVAYEYLAEPFLAGDYRASGSDKS